MNYRQLHRSSLRIPCGRNQQAVRPTLPLVSQSSKSTARLPVRIYAAATSTESSTRVSVDDRPAVSEASTSGRDERDQSETFAKARSRQWAKSAVLSAHKCHSIEINEKERPIAEYMALPASQYSVLDAQKIERLGDNTFRCYVGQLRFFGLKVEPVLTVSVVVGSKGPTVKLLATVLEGSPMVQAANDRFDATMTNVVTWKTGAQDGQKQLQSDASIQVVLEVPRWMQAFPVGAIEKTGSSVMQRVLNRMLPRFLSQLQADYELWASGDTSRTPIGTGQL